MTADITAMVWDGFTQILSGVFASAFDFLKQAASGTLGNAFLAAVFFAMLWWKFQNISTYIQIALGGLAVFFALKAFGVL